MPSERSCGAVRVTNTLTELEPKFKELDTERFLRRYAAVLLGVTAFVSFAYSVLVGPAPAPVLIPAVLILALVLLGVGLLGVNAFRTVRAWRSDSRSLARAQRDLGRANERVRVLRRQLSAANAEIGDAFEAGVLEGWARSSGDVLAPDPRIEPEIFVAAVTGGEISFLAHVPDDTAVDLGARFTMVRTLSRDVLGVLEVTSQDPGSGDITLVCVDRKEPGYWESLEQRPESDMSAPAGVRIVEYDPWEHHSKLGTTERSEGEETE